MKKIKIVLKCCSQPCHKHPRPKRAVPHIIIAFGLVTEIKIRMNTPFSLHNTQKVNVTFTDAAGHSLPSGASVTGSSSDERIATLSDHRDGSFDIVSGSDGTCAILFTRSDTGEQAGVDLTVGDVPPDTSGIVIVFGEPTDK